MLQHDIIFTFSNNFFLLSFIKIIFFSIQPVLIIFTRINNETMKKYSDIYLLLLKTATLLFFFEIDFIEYIAFSEKVPLIHEGLKFFFIDHIFSLCLKGFFTQLLSKWLTMLYLILRTAHYCSIEYIILIFLAFIWSIIIKIEWDKKNLEFNKVLDIKNSNKKKISQILLKDLFETFMNNSNNAFILLDKNKKMVLMNETTKILFKEASNDEEIENTFLNLEIIQKRKSKDLLKNVLLNETNEKNQILLEKNLSQLSSISTIINSKTYLKEIIQKLLEEIKENKNLKKSLSQKKEKFVWFKKDINFDRNNLAHLYFSFKLKGNIDVHFIKKEIYLSVILQKTQEINFENPKKMSKINNIARTFQHFSDELNISLNSINILKEILTKYLDYQNQLIILNPLNISLKMAFSLQEELVFIKEILCPKEDKIINDIIEFNLKNFLNEIVSLFTLQADLREINLIITYDCHLPVTIQSDYKKIKIILINLLSMLFYFLD